MAHVKTMGAAKTTKEVDITENNKVTAAEEDAEHKIMGIGAEAVVVEPTVILHITVGHTECVPIRAKTAGPRHTDNRRTRCGAIRCWKVN